MLVEKMTYFSKKSNADQVSSNVVHSERVDKSRPSGSTLPLWAALQLRSQEVLHRVCRWWEMDFQHWTSFSEWEVWFSAIRLPVIVKSLMEGVFYVAWWFIWGFRNRSIFDDNTPSRSKLFEDIVSSSFL
ncbi:hypothetical protein Tco_1212533 [Tanacetum coccineum]